MRKKPMYITDEFWKEFCRWADSNGVGDEEEDFTPWLDCWINGARTFQMLQDLHSK